MHPLPYVTRAFVRGGKSGDAKDIDMLLTISNDGWFLHSAELEQHLAAAVFRAVEHRIAVARSVNTGASAIIHPNGKIHDRVKLSPQKLALLEPVDAVLKQLDDAVQAMDAVAEQQPEYMKAWTELRKTLAGPLRTALAAVGKEYHFVADRLDGMILALTPQDAAKRRAALAELREQLDEDRGTIARWKEKPDTAPGYSVEEVKCDRRATLYTRWGDWFAQGCVGLFALMLLDWTLRRIIRKKTERGLSHG